MNRDISFCICAFLLITLPAPAYAEIGAAEKNDNAGWPYPSPAVPGATGYAPDYSQFSSRSEKWDILFHLLWRKVVDNDDEYYDENIKELIDTTKDPSVFNEALDSLSQLVQQIRNNDLSLPHRDNLSGCLLFHVDHDGMIDLAADDCGE